MDTFELDINQKIQELFHALKINGIIEICKLNSESYSKGIIISVNKFIDIYLHLNSFKRKNFWRNINYLNIKYGNINHNIKNKIKTANKKAIKKIILLIYLSIFINQISIQNNLIFAPFEKYFFIKKLYNLLNIMSSIVSKLYKDKIINIEELDVLLKLLIIFTMNNEYKNLKENNDIKNFMYFKECLNIIFITFNEESNEFEQKFLIDIFNYINNNICFRDKGNININYTNKFYLLNNDYKTTKLIKLFNTIYLSNNGDLTKIFF